MPSNPPDIDTIYAEHVWQVYAFFGYRINSREDAEDLTQITFERASRSLSRYDERRASVRTWLLAIARNLLIDFYRRDGARVSTRSLEPDDLDVAQPAGSTTGVLGLEPELENALDTLTPRDREVVALRYGGDLTGPEIAALMGLSLANVQQILSRSLRRMRAVIEAERELSAD